MTASSLHVDGPSARASPASRLAYDRSGQGEPLVLLHGQGFSRRSFDPVVPALAARRDVIAVDLPGHGGSPRQPKGAGNAPRDLAVAVAELLDELELPTVHVAGNSSGGWVALELAKLGRARTVTALAPAGLWRRQSAAAHPGRHAAGPPERQDRAPAASERAADPGRAGPGREPGVRPPVPDALRAGPRRDPRHGHGARIPRDAPRPGEGPVQRRRRDHRAGDGGVRYP